MTATNDTPPLSPPDPLARRQVVTSGPHVLRILLVAAVVIGLGLAAYMLGRSQGSGSSKVLGSLELPRGEPKLPGYEDMAPKPPPVQPPAPRFEKKEPPPPPARTQAKPAPKEDELRKKAMEAGVGGWSRKEDGKGTEPAAAGSPDFAAAGSDCFVPPGTPIPAQTVNRVVTERGGIVTARVTQDVWDAGFSCLAVPAGSIVTLGVGSGVTKGQKRIEVANPVITRPWPRNDTVRIAAVGTDATGAAGLAGTVQMPWVQTGLLIAASTAVDAGVAALTSGGSLIGGILGHAMDRPLDKAAKDLLDRAPVITLDAGEPVLLLLRGGLSADEFRR